MRAALAVALSALLPVQVQAQDWATAEVCSVEVPMISDGAFAPSNQSELEDVARNITNSKGKFWSVTGPNGAVSHLWGTFHSSDPLILALPKVVTAAIEDARTVAVEVDYVFKSREDYRDAQMMEGRFQDASDPFAFEPGDGSIAGLPVEVSDWIRDRALELGWTEDFDLIMSLPGMAEMLLSDPCEDFAQGILPIQDDYIQLLGRLSGARILSLEEPDEFIADLALDEDTARAVVGTYASYLKPMETNAQRAASFALYLQGQLGVMEAWDRAYQQQIYGIEGLDMLKLTDAYLLERRNHRFLERLAGALAEGDLFIAVGSAHLPGETGLVELLRNQGYDVTRIPLPGEAE